jgi:hypothetical protein
MSARLSRIARAPLLFLVLAVGACSSPAAPADAESASNRITLQAYQGTTLDHLLNANWDCQERFPGRISCAPPGMGLPPIPSLGENGLPVRRVSVFTVDGTPVGTAHFVRTDLYQGQTCTFTGQPYVLRALIGYYECFNAY